MEEPSWMQHSLESPQAGEGQEQGEGTPISAASAATASPGDGDSSSRGQEASSHAAALPEARPAAAAAAAVEPQAAAAAAGAVGGAAPYGPQHPSADGHMVWTNDDGDIDALPWDMGGWSTGSSAQQAASGEEEAEAAAGAAGFQQQERLQRPQADPVDEDALIGALRRKVGRVPGWGGWLGGWLAGWQRLGAGRQWVDGSREQPTNAGASSMPAAVL
jgi:hypothetical protein